MNELMEKINRKFSDVTATLKLHYYANVSGTIVFTLATILFINGAINENRVVFLILYILASILSTVIAIGFVRDFYEVIESRLRDTRNVVDIAMHRLEAQKYFEDVVKDYEENEKEHIPSIEE